MNIYATRNYTVTCRDGEVLPMSGRDVYNQVQDTESRGYKLPCDIVKIKVEIESEAC